MFLLQFLVAVSSFALLMFLLATTVISDENERCPNKRYSLRMCGVTKKSDCVDYEDYVLRRCSCFAACVREVGT